jgi:hypothetical protein
MLPMSCHSRISAAFLSLAAIGAILGTAAAQPSSAEQADLSPAILPTAILLATSPPTAIDQQAPSAAVVADFPATVAGRDRSSAAESPLVVVHLLSGRVFSAAIDQRTDQGQLWLRFDTPRAVVLRPISWAQIGHVEFADRVLNAEEFRILAASLRTGRALAPEVSGIGSLAGQPSQAAHGEVVGASGREPLGEPQAAGVRPRVASVDADAHVASWQSGVDADGLVVRVRPLDEQGCVVPAAGTIEVTLVAVAGQRRPSPHGRARAVDNQFPVIGRWTALLASEAVGPQGATFRFPFQAVHPEFNPHLRELGLVHVRLISPGYGVMEISVDPVRLHPLSPIRDRHQAVHGSRFLPIETTGR